MNEAPKIAIFALIVIALGGAGYYFGYDHGWESAMSVVPEPAEEEKQAEALVNPYADVKTNPLADVKTNPYADVKLNPFE